MSQGIVQLPTNLVNGLKSLFDGLGDIFDELPNKIKDVITGIFVPDTDYIKTRFNVFTDELTSKFGLDTSYFEDLFSQEKPVEDVYAEYDVPGVGKLNFKVFDTSWFTWGINYFRPIVRGFTVLMLLFYNIRQLIGFFGYDAGVVQGRTEWITYNKADTGGHKQ